MCLLFQLKEAEVSLATQAEAFAFCLAFRSIGVWDFCRNFCWNMWPIQEVWNQHFLFLALTLCVRCGDTSCMSNLTGWVLPYDMCLTGRALPDLLSSAAVSSRRGSVTLHVHCGWLWQSGVCCYTLCHWQQQDWGVHAWPPLHANFVTINSR